MHNQGEKEVTFFVFFSSLEYPEHHQPEGAWFCHQEEDDGAAQHSGIIIHHHFHHTDHRNLWDNNDHNPSPS